MDSRRLKKLNTSFTYGLTSNQLNKAEKSFFSNKFSLNYCFKYDVLYVYISSTMAAILMTPSLKPDAELR